MLSDLIEVIFKCLKFARTRLVTNFRVSLLETEFFASANFVLVSLLKLALGLLVLPVLFLKKTDFVVNLLQLVFDGGLFVNRRVYACLVHSQLVFALLNNFLLMSHSCTSLLNFSLHTFYLVTGRFIWILLGSYFLTNLSHLLTLIETDRLCLSYLLG